MSERLKEWTKHFLRHRDIFLKKIESIEDTNFGFTAHFKDNRDEDYVIFDNLELTSYDKEKNIVIVCMNNNKNFTKLLSDWKVLIGYPNIKIIFVEKINANKYWQVKPHHHDKITDQKSLKQGLKALSDHCKH